MGAADVEGNGLSGGLHIWEPLTHSCLLSACLWMNLDGTERDGEGGGGRVILKAEIQTGAGDCSSPAGGKSLGKRCSPLLSFLHSSDLWPELPRDLTCAIFQGRRSGARERQAETPVLGPAQPPLQLWTKFHVDLGVRVPSLKTRPPGQTENLFSRVEPWAGVWHYLFQ